MAEKKYDFREVSMIGRFAYCVMCAERYALSRYPEYDWKPLFTWMWQGTSVCFDEWYYHFMEILPEYLYEFNNYDDAEFDYLSREDYDYYTALLKDVDDNMKKLITVPARLSMIYSYSSIPGVGKESLDLVNSAIKILKNEHIELPDPKEVEFSSFSEKEGWGQPFDGKKLSIII